VLDVVKGAIGIADAGKLSDTAPSAITPIKASLIESSSMAPLGAVTGTSRVHPSGSMTGSAVRNVS
jgi:hypothetical protein